MMEQQSVQFVPLSLTDVSVQLIYSEGNEPAAVETFWNCYLIALAPFILGVPSSQVELFLAKGFLNLRTSVADVYVHAEGIFHFLPGAYRDYFNDVYSRASSDVKDIATLPPRTIRIISGHGFGNYTGGFLLIGKEKVSLSDLGSNATVLTILDICNASHAVASLTKSFPWNNPRSFNNRAKRQLFSNALMSIPIACDRNDTMWSFRIAYDRIHVSPSQDSFQGMSAPFGNSVTFCILAAIKSFLTKSLEEATLDELFAAKYSALKTSLLPIDDTRILRRRPFSDLKGLQRLIVSNVLPVNLEALLQCECFCRENEWFLTSERALSLLSPDEDKLASQIIELVAEGVKSWHESFPDSLDVQDESEKEWKHLSNLLGPPFSRRLKLIAFEYDEKSKTLYRSPEGIPLEEWAVSCGSLPRIVSRVRKIIETGELQVDATGEE